MKTLDLLLSLQVSLLVDVQRDDDCAEIGEPQGNEAAEGATAASDHHDFAIHTLRAKGNIQNCQTLMPEQPSPTHTL